MLSVTFICQSCLQVAWTRQVFVFTAGLLRVGVGWVLTTAACWTNGDLTARVMLPSGLLKSMLNCRESVGQSYSSAITCRTWKHFKWFVDRRIYIAFVCECFGFFFHAVVSWKLRCFFIEALFPVMSKQECICFIGYPFPNLNHNSKKSTKLKSNLHVQLDFCFSQLIWVFLRLTLICFYFWPIFIFSISKPQDITV